MKKIYLLLIALLITACQPISLPTITTYTLQTQRNSAISSSHTQQVLLVMNPIAAPGFTTNKIAYSQRPFEIHYFTRSEWVDPPAQMLLPLLTTALRHTHHFKAVVSEPFTGLADVRLDSQISQLIEKFDRYGHSAIVIEICAQLVDLHTNKILSSKTFMVNEPVTATNIYAAITAANFGTERILDDMATYFTHS